MRKLPPPMAQRIAMRLKGGTPDAAAAGAGPATGKPAGASSAAPPATTGGGAPQGGQTSPGMQGGVGGQGAQGRAGAGGDLQQLLSRLPATPLTEFQKGDAVMIVATSQPSRFESGCHHAFRRSRTNSTGITSRTSSVYLNAVESQQRRRWRRRNTLIGSARSNLT